MDALSEAIGSGARREKVCEVVGLSMRTIERWRVQGGGEDRRRGPNTEPGNKLSVKERKKVLAIANSPEFRDQSPKQIVPMLADQGTYIASERTFYRILEEGGQLNHREPSRPSTHHKPKAYEASGPCQVMSWDITYLKSPVTGMFFYLYLVVDIWSRKILAAEVHEEESGELAAQLFASSCAEHGVDVGSVLHADNGSPMKSSTMLATLQHLGVVPSFSRPHVSDDNPYSEALFRTLKYRPEFPRKPFESLDAARAWVSSFVTWYNTEHLHSSIRYVSPEARFSGQEATILEGRRRVYQEARQRHPERWTGKTRNWSSVGSVLLNPDGKLRAAA